MATRSTELGPAPGRGIRSARDRVLLGGLHIEYGRGQFARPRIDSCDRHRRWVSRMDSGGAADSLIASASCRHRGGPAMEQVDVVVIGMGPGGEEVAGRLAEAHPDVIG